MLPRGPFPLLPYRGLQPLNCYVVNRLLPSVPAEDWGLFCILSCRILNVQDPAGSQSFRINPSSAVLPSEASLCHSPTPAPLHASRDMLKVHTRKHPPQLVHFANMWSKPAPDSSPL